MNIKYLVGACIIVLTVAGCGGDDDDQDSPTPDPLVYSVEATNLTGGQPLSPIAVIIHGESFKLFSVGEPVSEPLEILAESGDNSGLLAAADNDANVYMTASGDGVLMPGMSETLMVEVMAESGMLDDLHLGLVTMLVNTNDAITAINGQGLAGLAIGDSTTLRAVSYDAGTELNTESADDIPGPAAAGGAQEGFDAVRDDIADELRMHSGVVTSDDGMAGSTLTEAHRWDNPVMQVVITRMQ